MQNCRIANKPDLIPVIDLGNHSLCGHFPATRDEVVPKAPLRLGLSQSSGLLQLMDTPPIDEMYGDNYGYRSGLNVSMVRHLDQTREKLVSQASVMPGDVVLDIGSNDGTLLNGYSSDLFRVGIDPTISKFSKYYNEGIIRHADFFSAESFLRITSGTKAKIITSISMFYDLPDPQIFCNEIAQSLHESGIWYFEQSYMPSMLRTNSYDTICQEHIEYYSLSVVKNLVETAGLRIIDVNFNSINGGSFAVSAAHKDSPYKPKYEIINWMLKIEERMKLSEPTIYREFERKAYAHKRDLCELLTALNLSGSRVAGYGASTKGNVILQFCGLTSDDLYAIADINEDKHGKFTPGTGISISSEESVKSEKPDYLLVLPWHFRTHILDREASYLRQGGKLIFPLPEIEIVG